MIRADLKVNPQTNTHASSRDSCVDSDRSERAIRISPIGARVKDCNRTMCCAADNAALRLQGVAASAKVGILKSALPASYQFKLYERKALFLEPATRGSRREDVRRAQCIGCCDADEWQL